MDVSKIVGFILPDWIADVLPGDYPIHSSDGVVKQNFKGKVLKIVTGDFKLFKIPVPYGHIWDSFLRGIPWIGIWDNYRSTTWFIYGFK